MNVNRQFRSTRTANCPAHCPLSGCIPGRLSSPGGVRPHQARPTKRAAVWHAAAGYHLDGPHGKNALDPDVEWIRSWADCIAYRNACQKPFSSWKWPNCSQRRLTMNVAQDPSSSNPPGPAAQAALESPSPQNHSSWGGPMEIICMVMVPCRSVRCRRLRLESSGVDQIESAYYTAVLKSDSPEMTNHKTEHAGTDF